MLLSEIRRLLRPTLVIQEASGVSASPGLHDTGYLFGKAKVASEFLPEFIAEALLAWYIEGQSFTDLHNIIDPLFNSEQGENQA